VADHSRPLITHFQLRALQDAVTEASAKQKLRKAAEFRAARHRPGIDYPGQATTVAQLRARWIELTQIAVALENQATLMPIYDVTPELLDLLREVA
jgi:hypothetical protein